MVQNLRVVYVKIRELKLCVKNISRISPIVQRTCNRRKVPAVLHHPLSHNSRVTVSQSWATKTLSLYKGSCGQLGLGEEVMEKYQPAVVSSVLVCTSTVHTALYLGLTFFSLRTYTVPWVCLSAGCSGCSLRWNAHSYPHQRRRGGWHLYTVQIQLTVLEVVRGWN